MLNSSRENIVFIILGAVFLVFCLCAFIVFFYYYYQKKQVLNASMMDDLKADQNKILMEAQLDMQKDTFDNMSKRIYSNIGLRLVEVERRLGNLVYNNKDELKTSVQESMNLFSNAMETLSDISRSMSSEIIKRFGLIRSLEYELDNIRKLNTYTASLSVVGESTTLTEYEELMIFRIIQEGLSNALKHAKATEIEIHLSYTSEFFTMELFDNGVGFSESPWIHYGYGLNNVHNRARLLHGSCQCYNPDNRAGAALVVEIPILEINKSMVLIKYIK